MDPAKLKVVELRAELSARGLDTKGVKAILVERLKNALETSDSGTAAVSQEDNEITEVEQAIVPRTPRGSRSRRRSPSPLMEPESTPRRASRRKSSVEDPAPTPVKIQHSLSQINESETEQEIEEQENVEIITGDNSFIQENICEEQEDQQGNSNESTDDVDKQKFSEEETTQEEVSDTIMDKAESDNTSDSSQQLEQDSGNTMPLDNTDVPDESCIIEDTSSNESREIEKDPIEAGEQQEEVKIDNEEIQEHDSNSKSEDIESKSQDVEQNEDISEDATLDKSVEKQEDPADKSIDSNMDESDSNKDNLSENVKLDDSEIVASDSPQNSDTSKNRKNKRSRWSNFQEQKMETEEIKIKTEEVSSERDDQRRSAKRKRSQSRSPVKMLCEDDEVVLEHRDSNVLLSWFDSDLHMSIDRSSLCKGTPLTTGALSHVWAGARTDRGIQGGFVAYEVLLEKFIKVEHKDDDSHLIRIGWSTPNTSLQLGEEPFSFGYDSSAKFVDNNEFKDYGAVVSENDIVGVYLDMDSSPCTVKYTVNGEDQGIAKEFEKSDLNGKALFPHILSKNISYKINFGQNGKSLLNRPIMKKTLKPKNPIVVPSKIDSEVVSKKDIEVEPKNDTILETEITSKVEKEESSETPKETEEEPAKDEGKSEDVEMKTPDENIVDEKTTEESQADKIEMKVEDSEEKDAQASEDLYEYVEESEEMSEQHFILPGYEYIGKVSVEALVEGPTQPDTRKECEVLMLCGLPAVGKTHWVEKWVREHPEKRYTVLGTHELVNRMKVFGEPKKASYKGNWQSLLESCSKSISELIGIAGKRRRNYIIDQNNVYTAVQVRKISNFGDFVRKAIVIVPSQEEWDKRRSERDSSIAEDVTESEMLTMKANFVLPEVNDYFDQVIFAELREDEARVLIDKYNAEGRDAGYAMRPAKRSRFDTSSDRSSGDRYRGNSDRRHNDRRDSRRNERSSSSGSGGPGFNRRGNDRHNDRMDRGGPPPRWGGGPPRFGGPPPPPPNWGGHRNNQWRGRERPPMNWRGGPSDHHRGGGGERGHNDRGHQGGGRVDYRGVGGRGSGFGAGGDRGHQRGGGQAHAGGGYNNAGAGNGAPHMRDGGGRWSRGGGGDSRRGHGGGRGGHSQGQGHWNTNNWNNGGGASGHNQWGQQQWGSGQNWGSGADQQTAGQDWSSASGQQQWNNQNWQQNWNQQNWGNGWKGYGQGWNQYWNQWGQQHTDGSTGTTNASTATSATSNTTQSQNAATTTAANNNQYSTTYPNIQYSAANSSATSQYPAQYSTDNAAMMTGGSNSTPDQIAQVYQSWAQYAQAFANYGQQQNAAAAASTTSSAQKAGTGDKKKKK